MLALVMTDKRLLIIFDSLTSKYFSSASFECCLIFNRYHLASLLTASSVLTAKFSCMKQRVTKEIVKKATTDGISKTAGDQNYQKDTIPRITIIKDKNLLMMN